jgi:hypothetical protein
MAGKEANIHFRGDPGIELQSAVRRGQIYIRDESRLNWQKLRRKHKKPAPVTTSDSNSIDTRTVDGLAEAADLIVRVLGGGVSVVIKGSQETVTAGDSGQTLNRTTFKIEGLKQNGESE